MRKITQYLGLTLLAISMAGYAQSGFNPFGGSSGKASNDDDSSYRSEHAQRDLSDKHKQKIDADHLFRSLASGGSIDLIVEYAAADSDDSDDELNVKKARHRHTKNGVKGQFAAREYQELRDFDAMPVAHVRVTSRRALVKLLSNDNVIAVYENLPGQVTGTENLTLIGQPAATTAGYTGAGTTVVVLDTGVNYTNPAFGCTAPGVPATCKIAAAFDVAANDNSMDDSGHGTNVAGIVAGVAPGARIAALDVFTPGAGAYSTDIIAGINWAITNKALYNIKSINISINWTTKYTSACTSSWATAPFASARAAGILPVVAAGNLGWTDGVSEPACAPGAVSVGAVYSTNFGSRTWPATSYMKGCTDSTTAADKVACFSDNASIMTMFAPGAVITAAGLSYGGTSQAAPHVAAAIAVLRAANAAPNDTVAQTVARLTSTGTSVKDTRNNLSKPRLNLLAAVNSIKSPTSATKTALSKVR
jgi:subtilisin family serine protease